MRTGSKEDPYLLSDLAAHSVTVSSVDLQEAYEIMNKLRLERAAYFTAGELLWIAGDDRRVRFVDDDQARAYLEEVRALYERVIDRRIDWWASSNHGI